MTSLGNWDRETGKLLKRIDIRDLSDQFDVRARLSAGAGEFLQQHRKPPMAQHPRAHPRHGGRDLGNNEGQSRRLSGYGVGSWLGNWVFDPSWHRLK